MVVFYLSGIILLYMVDTCRVRYAPGEQSILKGPIHWDDAPPNRYGQRWPFRFPWECLTHGSSLFANDPTSHHIGRRIVHTSYTNKTHDLYDRCWLNCTLMTLIVWSIVRCIAGARNIIRCVHNYDLSFHQNQKISKCIVISVEIMQKCTISSLCMGPIRIS